MILTALFVSLSTVALAYATYLLWSAARAGQCRPSGEAILLGAVTNFFVDTLGIGSFLVAGFFYCLANLGLMPAGGSATSPPIHWAIVAIAVHCLLGVLVCLESATTRRLWRCLA